MPAALGAPASILIVQSCLLETSLLLVGPADERADDATHPLQVPTAAHSVMFALPALHRTGYQVPVLRSECRSSIQTGSGKLLELGAAEASRSPPTWGLCERRAYSAS